MVIKVKIPKIITIFAITSCNLVLSIRLNAIIEATNINIDLDIVINGLILDFIFFAKLVHASPIPPKNLFNASLGSIANFTIKNVNAEIIPAINTFLSTSVNFMLPFLKDSTKLENQLIILFNTLSKKFRIFLNIPIINSKTVILESMNILNIFCIPESTFVKNVNTFVNTLVTNSINP